MATLFVYVTFASLSIERALVVRNWVKFSGKPNTRVWEREIERKPPFCRTPPSPLPLSLVLKKNILLTSKRRLYQLVYFKRSTLQVVHTNHFTKRLQQKHIVVCSVFFPLTWESWSVTKSSEVIKCKSRPTWFCEQSWIILAEITSSNRQTSNG